MPSGSPITSELARLQEFRTGAWIDTIEAGIGGERLRLARLASTRFGDALWTVLLSEDGPGAD